MQYKKMDDLNLFLTFCKGDQRCNPNLNKGLVKRNIPGGGLDFPLFRYVFSLSNRILMLEYLNQCILEQNMKAIENMNAIRNTGAGSSGPGIILILFFESFINQIYNIFENIAKINLFLFDDTKEQYPQDFFSQIDKIQKGAITFGQCYDEKILNMKQWYSEAVSIRHNTNHFMVGTSTYSENTEGDYIPQYLNYNVIDRTNPNPNEIKCDIKVKTKEYHDLTLKSLNQISGCYLNRIDRDVPCDISVITENGFEIHSVSLNQFISGEIGKVRFPYK